ncbi:MAG: cation-transporting P-type ATPase [Polyangiaceae bacterium]|nr:cation-transporting P-type ATPase [Polyangiaceae bacterium]
MRRGGVPEGRVSARQIHNLEAREVHALLGSRPEGLTDAEAARRLAELGPNTLAPPPRLRWLRILGKHVANLFSLLLWVAAALCTVADRMQPGEGMGLLGLALAAVALLNVAFSFGQEMRAERAMKALTRLLPARITVRRAGLEREVETTTLVPGDVVVLEEGDRIPCDLRLVEAVDLLVNNAPLTGESRHVSLHGDPVPGGRLRESLNLAFAGCAVLRGSGVGVAHATGARTEFGKLAELSVHVRRPPTPLEHEVRRTVRVLTAVAVTMGLLFFAYGVMSGRPIWVNVVFMLGIIVANVPEGLLPTLTLALARGSVRLARRRVLVKSLSAVEALGAVDVICTDKTGTLTRGELEVTLVADAHDGEPLADASARALLEAVVAASEIHGRPGAFTGDPLDVAAANALGRLGGDPGAVAATIVRRLAFDARRRRAAGVAVRDGAPRFAIKGAWEVVRPHVTRVAGRGGETPADATGIAAADATVHRLASRGLRVIAVAERVLTGDEITAPEPTLETDLVLLGFVCCEDPLRERVPDALARCHEAGIRVLLVTGDHPDTARAIAERAGILAATAPSDAVLTGDELEATAEHEVADRLRGGACVFARTTPEQKLKIVGALKHMGLVVAMTGDGVNDAPALRAADVGVAMGVQGTDVAREAAQIVLLDDDFASIVAGVEEGRAVFANVQKFTSYVLASNVPEIVPFLAYVTFPVPLALTVVQILSIDLGTDLLPAIGLGEEPPDAETMRTPPRGRRTRLLSASLMLRSYLVLGVLEAAWAMLTFFLYLDAGGWRWAHGTDVDAVLLRGATGLTLVAVVFTQVANLVGRRTETASGLDRGLARNPLLLLGIALELAFAVAVVYWPPLNRLLGTAPVPAGWVAFAALGAPVFFVVDVARKRLVRRRVG